MKYILKTLTPIHIGTGQKINPIEYLVEEKFCRINMIALFKDSQFDNEKFIHQSMKESIYLGDFAPKEILLKYIRYQVKISPECKNALLSKKNEVQEFTKIGDLPYIPGTSIRGALRTVALWNAMKKPSEEMRKVITALTKYKKHLRKVDDELEKLVFGEDPKYDIFKALHIGDSTPQTSEKLEIYKIQTLTTTREGHIWKGFITFIEGLKSEIALEGNLKIDEWLFTSPEWGFVDKQNLIKELPSYCNQFAKNLIQKEKKFYQKYNKPTELGEIIDVYSKLEDELKKCSKNEFLLHFAWGVGWHSMTIGSCLQEYPNFDFFSLRKMYELGKRRNEPYFLQEFPKTRKIVFENDKPKYPLGWVKIKWEEEQ